MNDLPNDFLRISCAVNRLSDGMWGGLQRPDPVAAIKQDQKKLSLGFGPRREKAGRRLRAAAVRGKLTIYVFAKPQVRSEGQGLKDCSPEKIEPVAVPVNVVRRLIASRGGLPDHPIRPSIKTVEGNEKLFALLTGGLLVVRASDFDVWYQSERAKGRWPSLPGSLSSILGGAGVGGLLGGGLSELLEQFTKNGQGETAESWIGPGPNKEVSPPQLKQAIGQDVLTALVEQTGLTQEELLARLSGELPTAVDKYTPDGRLPPRDA